MPASPNLLCAALVCACTRNGGDRRDGAPAILPSAPIEEVATDPVRDAASRLRHWWTAATTLRDPPVPLALGVTGIVAHVPEGLDASAPLHLVLFFHGSDQCALQLAEASDVTCRPADKPLIGGALNARHDDAGTQSIFAVPQFTLWGGGTPGRMREPGYFRSFVGELLGETFTPGLGSRRGLDDLADITLIGHSAGQLPVRSILERGDLADKVHNVVLIDALYDDVDAYARWLERGSDRKLVAVYGTWGHQAAHGREIAARFEQKQPGSTAVDPPGSFEHAIRTHTVTVKLWAGIEHSWMLLLMMTKVISGLDLPRRAIVPTRDPVGDQLRASSPLALDTAIQGTLTEGDTVLQNGAAADDYLVALQRGDRIVVDLRGGRSWTEPCCKLDVYAQLFEGEHLVAGDDDSGGFFDSRIEYTAAMSGPLLLRVTTAGSGRKTGLYSLRVATVRR